MPQNWHGATAKAMLALSQSRFGWPVYGFSDTFRVRIISVSPFPTRFIGYPTQSLDSGRYPANKTVCRHPATKIRTHQNGDHATRWPGGTL